MASGAPAAAQSRAGRTGSAAPALARQRDRAKQHAPTSNTAVLLSSHVAEPARATAAHARHAEEAVQIVDSVIRQGQAHDSLLKFGSESFWSYIDTAATDSSPAALRSIASAVSAIPDVPFAVKSSLASLAASVQSAAASSGLVPDFAPVRTALQASWMALRKSDLLPSLPQNGVTLPDLPGIPSLEDIQAGALTDITSSSLFNGTYTEQQIAAIVSAVIAISVISAATARATQPATVASDAELPTEYDEDAIQRYWSTRPVMLFKRSIETAWLASGFLVGLQLDKAFGEEKQNEKKRAKMLRMAVDRLGPAYIKIAQALSTRVDLLSPAYYEEIILLQDRVAPFPTDAAMRIMEEELGGPIAGTFSEVSPAPVASASLGQVYKAKLVGGGHDVAIKVQRPGVLELVALDLVLGRRGLLIANQLFPSTTRADDILPVLDEWASKFYREMDYRKEAAIMSRFTTDLKPLSGIRVPHAYVEHSTRRVLVTEWIEGEKLSESRAEDVKELCTTLLNAYLIQLLDTGLLHADPHPGNLIRTPDGKICILDFGLVTEVPERFRVSILEYMAHLSLKDWQAVGQDFVNLQFVSEDSMHPNDVPGLMDSVGVVLDALMSGGGMSAMEGMQGRRGELVDMVGLEPEKFEDSGFMDGFASVLTNLSNPGDTKGGNMSAEDRARRQKIKFLNEKVKFRLPPYFVLILRAFSVIEGIALKVDPKYSIISETFPYLARRLLTDDNEEVRRALRQVLYGNGTRMDLSRFRSLFDSLGSFTTDGLTARPAAPAATGAPAVSSSNGAAANGSGAEQGVLDKNTLLALQSILNSSGKSYIQELLVSELAATVDSLSRGAAVTLLQRALQSSLTNGTLAFLERLGPARRLIFPFPLPAEIITQLGGVVKLTEEDKVAIANVETVWQLLQPQVSGSVGQGNLQMSLLRSFASTVGELPGDTRGELLAGAGRTSQMVLQKVVQRTAARVAEDLGNVRQQQGAIDGVLGRDDTVTVSAPAVPVAAPAAQASKAA